MKERDLEVVDAVRLDTIDPLLKGLRVESDIGIESIVSLDDARSCIFGTRLALDVLKTYQIFGRALKVHTMIYNRAGWAWQNENGDEPLLNVMYEVERTLQSTLVNPTDEDATPLLIARGVPADARVRFCGVGTDLSESFSLSEPGWLNGHCVALLDLDGTPMVLDPTAQQFTTPQFKLFVPPVMFEVEDEWARDPAQGWVATEPEELNGGAILYRQPSDLAGVFDAPDWKVSVGSDVVAAIRGKVEERLALMRL